MMIHDTNCQCNFDQVENDADDLDVVYEDNDKNNVEEMAEGTRTTSRYVIECYRADDGFYEWMSELQPRTFSERRISEEQKDFHDILESISTTSNRK